MRNVRCVNRSQNTTLTAKTIAHDIARTVSDKARDTKKHNDLVQILGAASDDDLCVSGDIARAFGSSSISWLESHIDVC